MVKVLLKKCKFIICHEGQTGTTEICNGFYPVTQLTTFNETKKRFK